MPANDLRTFRAIPNPETSKVDYEELTDIWRPVVEVPGENMASDAELAAAIVAHSALPDVHHPANVGITGTKTLGGFRFTFTDGLLTGFEPV